MANNVIRKLSKTIKFIDCCVITAKLHNNIISVTIVIYFISKTTLAHFIYFFNLRAIVSKHALKTLNQSVLSFFLDVWADDIHDFIFSHPLHLLLVLAALLIYLEEQGVIVFLLLTFCHYNKHFYI